MKPVILFLLISLAFLSACSDDNSVGDNDRNGNLVLSLTDQPVELSEVWVTITNIEVHKTGGAWISFDSSEESVDLLTLENREQVLQSAPLEDGKYTGIRLEISEGHIIDAEGERCDLKIPSGKVQINSNFDIESGQDTEVLLDFDAEKSVHVVRTGKNERCNLRPVIHVESVEQTAVSQTVNE